MWIGTFHSLKDPGIIENNNINFKENIHDKIKKAYLMFGILKRNFKYMNAKTWAILYKSIVRSRVVHNTFKLYCQNQYQYCMKKVLPVPILIRK